MINTDLHYIKTWNFAKIDFYQPVFMHCFNAALKTITRILTLSGNFIKKKESIQHFSVHSSLPIVVSKHFLITTLNVSNYIHYLRPLCYKNDSLASTIEEKIEVIITLSTPTKLFSDFIYLLPT